MTALGVEEKIVKRITNYCCSETMEEEDREVIEYGLALMVETVFKYLLLFLFSLLIGKVKAFCSFFVVFGFIRANGGGFHCQTNLGCTLSLVSLYLSSLLADWIVVPQVVVWILFFICFVVCAVFAPSSTENNPIMDKHIRLRKKVTTLVLLMISIAEYQWTWVGLTKGAFSATYLGMSILVVLLEVRRKK